MSENIMATKADLQRMYNKILPYLGGTAEAGFTPVGTVIAVMGNSAPANYLACNGQVVNIVDYPVLADYFENQFGTKNHFGGDGITTFGIPDLRGEFLRGTGTNSHANQGNGANVGTHQNATEIPHTINREGVLVTYNDSAGNNNAIGNRDSGISGGSNTNKGYDSTILSTTPYSTSVDVIRCTVRPTNTSVLYCIATHNIFMNPANQYSTQEQVVGTWIDGKPIYQKTIVDTMPTVASEKTKTSKTILTDASIDKFVSVNGFVLNNGVNLTFPIVAGGNNEYLDVYARIATATSPKAINVQSWSTSLNETDCYITIQYTKTT